MRKHNGMRRFFGIIAGCVMFVGFAVPANAGTTDNITAESDDGCPRDHFTDNGFSVVCDDDFPCEVVVAKTYTGECWWAHNG